MPNAVWPVALPSYALEAGYQESLEDQTIETQMDSGPVKVRRRFTTAFRKYQLVIQMDAAQMAIFETFYLDTLQGGSLPFDWVHPRTRAAKTFRFRRPPPSLAPIGGTQYCRVTMSLESLP
jgi:trans-aconitate methyltransferase